MRFLSETVEYLAAELRAAALPCAVYAVDDPGYAMLAAPYVAINAPRANSFSGYLSGRMAASVAVPIRVAGSTAQDGAGLLTLTDAVLTVLRAANIPITAVAPAVIPPTGAAAPMPVYEITVELALTETE